MAEQTEKEGNQGFFTRAPEAARKELDIFNKNARAADPRVFSRAPTGAFEIINTALSRLMRGMKTTTAPQQAARAGNKFNGL